jgi:hypothetical protein
MFSPKIVESDEFMEMPQTSQNLYFHLGMNADDDGFVNPRKIMKILGSSGDDLKVLVSKRFVLPFENGVVVIKHWLINNTIRKDIYQHTLYTEQLEKLTIKDNRSYTDNPSTCRQQSVNVPFAQIRLDKSREDKIREEYTNIYSHWNSKNCLQKHNTYPAGLDKAMKKHPLTEEQIKHSIDNYSEVIGHPEKYWFDYKWSLVEFVQRGRKEGKGCWMFVDDVCLSNMAVKNKKKFEPQRESIKEYDPDSKMTAYLSSLYKSKEMPHVPRK